MPSEPYEFRDRHLDELRDELSSVTARLPVVRVDGQDLFWWGSRTSGGVPPPRQLDVVP